MKKLDKKDLPKLVVLVILSVCLFGFSIVQFTATPTKAASPARADAQPAAAVAQGEGAAAEQGQDAKTPDALSDAFNVADIAILTSGKDPFVPNGPAAPRAVEDRTVPAPSVAPPGSAGGDDREGALRSLMGLPAGNPGAVGAAASRPPQWMGPRELSRKQAAGWFSRVTAPVVLPPPPPPAFTVTGVVRGDRNVAILRGGPDGDERRFVRAGDLIGNGFKVIAVRADGVEIQSGDRRVTLKLGGDSLAK